MKETIVLAITEAIRLTISLWKVYSSVSAATTLTDEKVQKEIDRLEEMANNLSAAEQAYLDDKVPPK